MATNYDSDESEFGDESLLEPQVLINDDEDYPDDDDDNLSNSSMLEVQIDDRWLVFFASRL